MKLIDRYVAWSYLKDYLISFFALVGIVIVMDMTMNFDELVVANTKYDITGFPALVNFVKIAGDYYFYQIFLYFIHLSSVIPIVAACFTLMRMIRFNELSALLSSGVPLLRIAMPVIVVGLLLNGLLWVDQEMVIPNMIPKLIRQHDYAVETDARSFPVWAMRDDVTDAKLFAGRYTPASQPPRMEYVSIIKLDQNDEPLSHIKADRATWDEASKSWKLENFDSEKKTWGPGQMDENLSPTFNKTVRTTPITTYKGSITPEQIQLFRSGEFVDLLSTRRIDELLASNLSYGRAALLRVKHTRGIAQIGLNMVLLLLAIACVLTREPQRLKTAALWCIGVCAACLTLAFGGQMLAGMQPPSIAHGISEQWPALMAWLPIFVFGPISIFMLDRVKT